MEDCGRSQMEAWRLKIWDPIQIRIKVEKWDSDPHRIVSDLQHWSYEMHQNRDFTENFTNIFLRKFAAFFVIKILQVSHILHDVSEYIFYVSMGGGGGGGGRASRGHQHRQEGFAVVLCPACWRPRRDRCHAPHRRGGAGHAHSAPPPRYCTTKQTPS